MRKFLLFPLRLCVGWGLSPRLLGFIGVAMLVLLRASIGWHFYTEGVDKLQSGNWSAAPFFSNARGPFAEQYRALVWDHDGQIRLNPEATMTELAFFRDDIAEHYGFSEQQRARAQENYNDAVAQYNWVLEDQAVEIEEFIYGRDRVTELDTDRVEKAMRDGVTSLGGQRDTIRREWQQKAAVAFDQIDLIFSSYEKTQNALATPEQAAAYPPFRLIKPPTNVVDTSTIDQIVPYFDMAIGLCLLFGLFTPPAALAAAGFLGSVFLSQLPPSPGPTSTYYHLVESMACLVLAGTGAGRFAGLDYFLHLIVRKVWGAPGPDTAA